MGLVGTLRSGLPVNTSLEGHNNLGSTQVTAVFGGVVLWSFPPPPLSNRFGALSGVQCNIVQG